MIIYITALLFSAIIIVQGLTGGAIAIPTLDSRTLTVPITEVISPGYEKCVTGEGMPVVENPVCYGNLLIRFNLMFPSTLNQQQKSLIKQALGNKGYN